MAHLRAEQAREISDIATGFGEIMENISRRAYSGWYFYQDYEDIISLHEKRLVMLGYSIETEGVYKIIRWGEC